MIFVVINLKVNLQGNDRVPIFLHILSNQRAPFVGLVVEKRLIGQQIEIRLMMMTMIMNLHPNTGPIKCKTSAIQMSEAMNFIAANLSPCLAGHTSFQSKLVSCFGRLWGTDHQR